MQTQTIESTPQPFFFRTSQAKATMTTRSPTERKRLIQAVVFFALHTKYCGKIKLFKLLYLFDFEHFRQTGKSATGLDYQAWKFGPVPLDLMEEWEELNEDLASVVYIESEKVIDLTRQSVKVKPGVEFDDTDFSTRQLRIMQELVAQYTGDYSEKMIDVTHAQNGAWDKVWQGGQGAHNPIPYALAIGEEAPDREALLTIAHEQAMYQAALQAARNAAPAA